MGEPSHTNPESAVLVNSETEETFERRTAERRREHHPEAGAQSSLPAEPALWTAADVARFLRVGRNRPYELVERGELACIRIGQRLRFDPAKVREFLERQTTGVQLRRGGR